MNLSATEKRSILQGHHPALSRETKVFAKGEVIAIRSLRSLKGPVPVVSVTITNVKRKGEVYLPEYTIRDDRVLYLKRGAGYTRVGKDSVDPDAPVLDEKAQEQYTMEGRLSMAESKEGKKSVEAEKAQARAARSELTETLSGMSPEQRPEWLAEFKRLCQKGVRPVPQDAP